jgi:4-amino-4-deoxy-L-arabinose transferase-like glycosyltransferase
VGTALKTPFGKLTIGKIIILGLALRLAWFFLCPNEPSSDQWIYHISAVRIASGQGYIDDAGRPANYWPVGYPALLVPFYALFGPRYATAFAVNIFISLFMLMGAYRLGRVLFGPGAALIAALLIAVHPTLVMHTTILSTEMLFSAGALWLLWLMVRAAKSGTLWGKTAPLAGVLLGLLVYVRPTAQAFLLLPPLFGLLWRRQSLARVAAATAVVLLCSFVVLLPWGMRNQRAFNHFSLTSMNGGSNFWMGNNPETDGMYMALPSEFESMPLVERESKLGQLGMTFVREHPLRYLVLCAKRVYLTMRSDTIAAVWNAKGITRTFGNRAMVYFKVLCSLAHWALLIGVILALTFRRRRFARADLALVLAVGILAAPFVLIVGGNRYMTPLLPLLCIWAASSWHYFKFCISWAKMR